MTDKTKAPAGAGTPTEAMVETAALAGTAISCEQDTTDGAARQPHRRIFDYLLDGEEHAIPGHTLAKMLNIPPRRLRRLLRAAERGPLVGQESLFVDGEGSGGDGTAQNVQP